MLLGNPDRDGEAEACTADAFGFRARGVDAVEALEDFRLLLGRDADAVIAEREQHAVPLAHAARRDMAAIGRVLRAVLEEDAHHLAHHNGVGVDGAGFVLLERDRVLLRHELHLAHDVFDELGELEVLLVEHLALLVGAREEPPLPWQTSSCSA